MYSITNNLQNNVEGCLLEQLPPENFGKILQQLPNVIGSIGVPNEADIPLTMGYMQNLACTSKRIYSYVHDPYITKLFFCSLAKKYCVAPESFAAELNTEAARIFLWNYIKESKLDEDYNVIQNIYSLASSVLQEAKEAEVLFNYFEGRKQSPLPNPLYYQTKSGVVLYCNSAPNHIATPFGEIIIFNGGSSSGNSHISASEVFIKRLNATFEKITEKDLGITNSNYYEISNSLESNQIRKINPEEFRPIHKQDLENKKGSKNLILDLYPGNYSVYKINEIYGKILPEPICHSAGNQMRSFTLVRTVWEMLEKNRLGKDPISKEFNEINQKKYEGILMRIRAFNIRGKDSVQYQLFS